MQDGFVTPDEIAAELRVTVQTVYSWIGRGVLKAIKVGGLWRIPTSAYKEFKGIDGN